jgi:predicted dehydrogenase
MRHARVLREEGCEVAIVSAREIGASTRYATVLEGVIKHRPEYVVIANRTVEHRVALEELAANDFQGIVLVEKPLFANSIPLPPNRFERLLVAYNLRFHPGVQLLRDTLQQTRALSVLAYVGQYLPTWRPSRDYRSVYSASKAAGGGVLRDLSHELDYLNWIFGGWNRVTALGGHLSTLDIDSEDTAVLIAAFHRCPAVSVQLNYLDRIGRRFVIVNSHDHTIELNITGGYMQIDDWRTALSVGRDETYRAQHRAILSGSFQDVCTAEEGLDVLQLVEAVEEAMEIQRWVRR